MKTITYKGCTIEKNLSGWYSALTPNGYVKADTLTGIKKIINQYL